MKTKDFICREVKKTCIASKGLSGWKANRGEVYKLISQLQPGKPEDGTINFLAYNVPNNKPRMKMKTGRFLAKRLQLNSGFLPEATIEHLSNCINLELFGIPESGVRILSGADITKAYRDSFGASSCMTNYDCDKTKLYEDNPDNFRMLTMQFGNDKARAIIHTLDNGDYLLDRVYASSEALKHKMQEYANAQGWYYRKSFGACNSKVYRYGNAIEDYSVLTVSELYYQDGEVPYMDTLTCASIYSGMIDITHPQSGNSYDYDLDKTDGYIESRYTCDSCGDSVNEDDYHSTDDGTYCYHCYHELYFYCQSCYEDCARDDAVWIDDKDFDVCHYCATNNYYKCNDCDTWHENATYIEDGDFHVCEKCFDNYQYCEDCNTYHHLDNNIYIESAERDVCEDCAEAYPKCEDCGERHDKSDMTEFYGCLYCQDCAEANSLVDCEVLV